MIVIAIERQLKNVAVALRHGIAPKEAGLDTLCTFCLEHARADSGSGAANTTETGANA